MSTIAVNPFLPGNEYIPDGEPRVFGDRVYLFGSHDRFDGGGFCLNDYVCWSAPVDDLGDWRYEGVIYRKDQDPRNIDAGACLYAPDVVRAKDGRYYLYYCLDTSGVMSVAVCDEPAEHYAFYGFVRTADGHVIGDGEHDIFQFDPGVLVDDDGRVYIYSGFGPQAGGDFPAPGRRQRVEGSYFMELDEDMLTVRRGPELLFPKAGLPGAYEGHAFFEASSIRKIDDRYCFIYSSESGHELCYALSDRPDGGFRYGGTIISNGDIGYKGRSQSEPLNYTGNNHGSLVHIAGQWYIFYHRQTNRHSFSRQACAEPVCVLEDGSIPQVAMSSCGLNGGALPGAGCYEARIACNLLSKQGACFYRHDCPLDDVVHPCFTQDRADSDPEARQYIAGLRDGAQAGFKWFLFRGARFVAVRIRGDARGHLIVSTERKGAPSASIPIEPGEQWHERSTDMHTTEGICELWFRFEGTGVLDFLEFEIG